MSFNLKISQHVTLSLKALRINCLLWEDLKENEYNYSLKLVGATKDYSSERSNNLKNPCITEKKLEIFDENCDVDVFDEGIRCATGNYFSNEKNPISSDEIILDKAGTRDQPKTQNEEDAHFPEKASKGGMTSPGLIETKKTRRLVWEHNEDDTSVPFLDV